MQRILQHLHVGLYCLQPFWDGHGELVIGHGWNRGLGTERRRGQPATTPHRRLTKTDEGT